MDVPKLIPWHRIADWECRTCGECCNHFEIPLRLNEYVKITRLYSLNSVRLDVGKAYLKKTHNGRCIFQISSSGRWLCGLQECKPLVCKLWPFAILKNPLYGENEKSAYQYYDNRYYVYVHPYCRGLIFGKPTCHFTSKVIPEAVKLSLHLKKTQHYTTADLSDLRENCVVKISSSL
jgi:Fe-S-cluster containining protein